jgi:hypothetical protein
LKRLQLLAAMGLLCGLAAAQPKPDFSGTWKLNNDRSTPRGPADRVYLNTITEGKGTISVTTKAEGVHDILDGTLPINGKNHIEKVSNGYRLTKASWEGATLVLEIADKDSKKDTAKYSLYIRESWQLSPDGTVLTRFRRTAEGGKVNDQKFVFDKQ